MKKLIVFLCAALMLFSASACGSKGDHNASSAESSTAVETSEEISYDEILTSETWFDISYCNNKEQLGGRLSFNSDGTGHFKCGSIAFDTIWTLTDDTITMDYTDENGAAQEVTNTLSYNDEKGRYELNNGDTFVLESDALVKVSDLAKSSEIELGTYEQDGITDDGQENILWVVCDKTKIPGYVILVSEYGLDCKQYNKKDKDNITWETCSLRKWLNGKFFNTAFTEKEQALIQPVNLQNPDNKKYETGGGNDTLDKVWIFSEYDLNDFATDIRDENHGQTLVTDYVKSLGVKSLESSLKWFNTASYWLRTPGVVAYDDSNMGEVFSNVTEKEVVRPVIVLADDAEVFAAYEAPTQSALKSTTKPEIGMTKAEVLQTDWGTPEDKNVTETAGGTSEQWCYSDGRYVYFDNDVVTSVQY